MKFDISIDGRSGILELNREGETCRFRLQCDGKELEEDEASLIEVQPGIYSVLIAGRSYEAKIVPGHGAAVYVDVDGRHMAVEVQDPRSSSRRTRRPGTEGRQQLDSPMPGKVVKVLVEEGDQVEAGQGLVVVEAMKMQNEMKAPRAGRITSLNAREGATVNAGEVLVVMD